MKHGKSAPHTKVTVADISGFTKDMLGMPLGLGPSFSVSVNNHQNSSHLAFPEGHSDLEHPKASQTQVFLNPKNGNSHVVTEGNVPLVRANLSESHSRIPEQWAGEFHAVGLFFSLRAYSAGLCYRVVETAVSKERHILF
ncbi:MAG: hypothetical protein N2050_00020 [Flavobacteriales bacterium]|nr:hypothetical protein [Flavobacteriales bacterium]